MWCYSSSLFVPKCCLGTCNMYTEMVRCCMTRLRMADCAQSNTTNTTSVPSHISLHAIRIRYFPKLKLCIILEWLPRSLKRLLSKKLLHQNPVWSYISLLSRKRGLSVMFFSKCSTCRCLQILSIEHPIKSEATAMSLDRIPQCPPSLAATALI